MKRRFHLDQRGVPYGHSVELDEDDLRRRNYSLLRLVFLLPLLAVGYLAFGAAAAAGWHPVLAMGIGFGIPVIGGALIHFVPLIRLIYDASITIACAAVAFFIFRDAEGGDWIWGTGAAVLTLLVGAWMTIADVRGSDD